ncbi:MAG TPA: hypothetical protein VFB90_07815 [Dehalococcoidia bacterium]|nr:hypothetical protein [Dehalococcoidia bacterium]
MANESMIELGNEFAWVRVERDDSGLSPRLRIQNMRSGAVGYFDALELEVLSTLRHDDLKPLMDPGFDGWNPAEGASLWQFLHQLGENSPPQE